MLKQKSRLLEKEEYKKKKAEERKQEIQDRVNPYEREIETCDHVIAYLTRKMIEAGLVKDDSSLQELQKEVINQDNKVAVEKKINDGKILRALSKEEKETEGMMIIGGKGKKKGGKKQKHNVVVTEVFNLDIQVINKFSFLKVSPPLDPSELEEKIKELKEAREKYIEEGEKKLNELEKNGFEEEEEEKEEDEKEDKGRHRGGNDYRGRGGYKGREGAREGGRGKKQEFEAEDDEEEVQQHNKKAARPNRQEDLNKDQDNFPTLGI
mmetsp:Transcript_11214/g.11278  ORF Transcript_11214/g.11278 Transcript_11214/m.11278 type:complete len:266 (-) Transcript_11214:108-905(-)